MAEDDYKCVIKQYMDTVKEIVGDSETFDKMFESVVKIQERVIAANTQNNEGALIDGEDQLRRISCSTSDPSIHYKKLVEEIKIIKKRILRLERKIFRPREEA